MKRKTYLQSIRAFCLECMGGSSEIVRQNSSGQQFLASNLNDLSQIKANIPILAKNRL